MSARSGAPPARSSASGELEDAAAAAIVAQIFAAIYVVLWATAPATPAQLDVADPLVQLVLGWAGPGAIPLAAVLAGALWTAIAWPSRHAIRGACRSAMLALVLIAIGLPLVRLLVGPTLPAFIPPEEGSAPGMLLSFGAGLVEEVIFRLGVLPVALAVGASIASRRTAATAAVLATGLAFALSHEIGPGAHEFSQDYFLSRFLFPGCIMSMVALRVGIAFVVAGHCGAHLLLPLLFR